MDVLTSTQMQNVDEETIRRFFPGLELMERAGRKVAEFVLERFPRKGFRAVIFAGAGNNGGDALVVARYLSEEKLSCSVHFLGDPREFSMDASKNYQRFQRRMKAHRGLKEFSVSRPDWVRIVERDLYKATVIIDGLFGTGLSRPLEGKALEIVKRINAKSVPVVSIDIPSGVHGDTGAILGEAVRATHTLTIGCPKLGMLFFPGRANVGNMVVADIGFPAEVIETHSVGIHLLDMAEAALRLPPRPPDVHKYRCGTVLLVSGSRAYTGAAMLAAEAALRSGCGMVYAAVPDSIRMAIESRLREVITVPVPETSEGTVGMEAVPVITPYFEKADVVAIGPGLGRNEETDRLIHELVGGSKKPIVLDADGINAFAGQGNRLKNRSAPLVLTPHSGELEKLLSKNVPELPIDRVETTREVARSLGVTLVHKGAPTLVASDHGDVWVNYHGNSSLATAGTGDVLTGMVAGLAAQGAAGLDAACVASALHGRAAELASAALGLRGVIAGDLLRYLGPALVELEALAKRDR